MEEERFDIVNENDEVVGQGTRDEVHKSALIHRSVHTLVFNSRGELFIQKRVLTKDENPGLLDTSSAGHVSAGEDYLASAQRELQEELGLVADLTYRFKIKACPETFWEHVCVYTCVTDDPVVCDPGEISEGRYWKLDELQRALGHHPEEFTPTFYIIFQELLKNGEGF